MKYQYLFIAVLTACFGLLGCTNTTDPQSSDVHTEAHDHGHQHAIEFTNAQYRMLGIITDTLLIRNLGTYVEATGQLEVPPQNEASVTAIIGANITHILVIEGDKVRKGQTLARLSHPDLIKLQTDYQAQYSQLQYHEKEYERQKQLYAEKVSSGQTFQKSESEYLTLKAAVKGLDAQLQLLGMDISGVRGGEIFKDISVGSPIDGHVRKVEVKIGQYLQPQTQMFELVNIEHIHADLMVFERDIHKVKEGQKIRFKVASVPQTEMEATIYAVGKSFEQEPKALHIHAEIENKEGLLLPGMYVQGRILTKTSLSFALPEEGIAQYLDKYYAFSYTPKIENGDTLNIFSPVEVYVANTDEGLVEIRFLEPVNAQIKWAQNNAYHLLSEWKKEDAEHSH
jgi:cobalt-zinc-cadmium efflux system membrane fusion protein